MGRTRVPVKAGPGIGRRAFLAGIAATAVAGACSNGGDGAGGGAGGASSAPLKDLALGGCDC